MIAVGQSLTINSSRERAVDGKVIGELFQLSDGNEYLVTTKEKVIPQSIPEAVGIIQQSKDGPGSHWIWHREIEQHKTDWDGARENRRRERVRESWCDSLRFRGAEDGHPGFRRPQLGAMYSIGAHWSLSSEVATVVMPTGTGKTETMLAATVGFKCGCVLVVTPSNAVRDQVAEKFITLGKLREFGLLDNRAMFPVVGVIKRRPRTTKDLVPFRNCNVIVSTVSAIAQGTADPLAAKIAELCTHLFIDEAHHIAARTWRKLRDAFAGKPVLQFTATPFREDGERVDGKIIYSYPLGRAQMDGFFRHIHFNGVFEEDSEKEDESLARAALTQLRTDLAAGMTHSLMARCANKRRAGELFRIYSLLAPDLNPVLIHSDITRAKDKVEQLKSGRSKIVVCVNMLAEGFDLPTLKIAAVHDKHKSLGVLMQFAGRFTRSSGSTVKIGDASIFANVADPDVAESLRHLFVEDADWDSLLAEVSLDRIEREQKIIEFIRSGRRIAAESGEMEKPIVALAAIRPRESAVIYESAIFDLDQFILAKGAHEEIIDAWKFADPELLVYVTAASERPPWTRAKNFGDRIWLLYMAYFNRSQGLLFLHCSDPDNICGALAAALSNNTAKRVEGTLPFRVFGGINRLTLHQVGIKKHGARRAISYTQVSGTDVKPGLAQAELNNSSKAMISGTGFEQGGRVAVGGSRKGKVWARQTGVLSEYVEWCDQIATKIRDTTIDPDAVIRDGLKPEPVEQFPSTSILRIEWGDRLLGGSAMSSVLVFGSEEYGLLECDLEIRGITPDGAIAFAIVTIDGKEFLWSYRVKKGEFTITKEFPMAAEIRRGRNKAALQDFLNEDPPAFLLIDGSEIIGGEVYRPTPFGGEYSADSLVVKNWMGCNIRTESIWKDRVRRDGTVQGYSVDMCRNEGFDLIFNDDDAGEIADLVCFKRSNSSFIVRFVHCKFSSEEKAGARSGDVTEVASQASRSVRWTGRIEELIKQMRRRAKKLNHKDSRFIAGSIALLNTYERLGAAVRPSYEIVAVQPGVSKKALKADQKTVLGAADSYLRQTVEIPLVTWCSE